MYLNLFQNSGWPFRLKLDKVKTQTNKIPDPYSDFFKQVERPQKSKQK